ncbi:MAG: BCAM0308 family protein [Actinomycetota bacterium]
MGKSFSKNPSVNHPVSNPATTDPRAVLARDQIQDYDDPDIPDRHYPDGTVCVRCHAVYRNQHWNRDTARAELALQAGAQEVVCPGCKIVAERNPRGIVTLSGDYWPQHKDDILNLIRNEETRGMSVNPLERIIDIREEADALIIETTTEKLAQKIARAIDKAHQGSLVYHWPDNNHLIRVDWERQLKSAA